MARIDRPGHDRDGDHQHKDGNQDDPQAADAVDCVQLDGVRLAQLVEQAATHQPPADQEKDHHGLVRETGEEGQGLVPQGRIGHGAQAWKKFTAQMGGGNLNRGQPAQQ